MPFVKGQSGNPATQFKPGESGNPTGPKPGYKHLSTWIQEIMNDEEFTLENFMANGKTFKGAPVRAITTVAVMQALQGEQKWADWLGKYGYGTTSNINQNINDTTVRTPDPELAKNFADYLKSKDTK